MTDEQLVLVAVEDDPDFQRLIRVTLGGEPRLKMAKDMPTSIESAVELAHELSPRLIVLDHNLQGKMVGLSGARKLKKAAPEAKILLFTAYDVAAEARRESAVDEYLHKDNVDQLLATALRLLELA
ncbi:MAG: response regulator [Actinomycetota bacterium]